MKEKEIVICKDCGKKIEGEKVEIDGEYVCEECFEENYFYCEDCGCIEEKDNGYWIDSCEKLVCQKCLDSNYFRCEDCNEYFSYDDSYYYIHGESDNYYVCDDCYYRGCYSYCDGCGNYFESDMCHWQNDYCYCDDCYDEENDGLYNYHEFNDWYFYKSENEEKPSYYIGKEIELEPLRYSDVDGVINAIDRNINAVGMEDGSLDGGGVEVVTHPESWEYLQEHKENYIKFFEDIQRINYGDGGGAGLHFHVSRPNENVVSRIIILLESFKDEVKKLSRRDGDFHWSHFLTDFNTEDRQEILKYRSSKYLKEEYIKGYHDRYMALNLCNSKTIEFRFFNGANNFEEFWGALQFIHNIMEIALDEERDVNTIEWNELIYGEELIEQAKKQEVYQVDKKAKDTTELLERLQEITEKAKEEIKKSLKNLIRFVNKEIISYNFNKSSNITEIEKNTNDLLTTMLDNTRYLGTIIDFYKNIDNYNMNYIQRYTNDIRKDKKYDRYYKQMENAIKNYESEVAV